MSKKKRNKDKIFMEVNSEQHKEPYLLQVPEHFRHVLDKMSGVNHVMVDYQNSASLLKVFCDKFCELSDKQKRKYELLINSRAVQPTTLADLLFIVLQIDKYYVLPTDSYKALGEFHIISARQTDPESWVAKSTFDEAEELGRKIMRLENGKFFKGHYVGQYYRWTKTDD